MDRMMQHVVVVLVHPSLGRLRRNICEAEGPHPPRPDRWSDIKAHYPERRMRLLIGFGDDISGREIEELTLVLPVRRGEHRNDGLDGSDPAFAFRTYLRAEVMQFGGTGPLAHAELDAPLRQEIERRDPLRRTVRLICRGLDDAVPEPDVLCSLARRTL